ncbi:MAG: GIY-YIG nuclease family protein [Candidatus Andersenbacteria bacterium]|nr:GIY-YIG nuclease family protein [Candidatus Andersenbacteria bacterium]
MYYVYILELVDGKHYIGFAADLKKRLLQHKHNTVFTTKNQKADKLVFYAAFATKKLALDFEKYLKSSSGFAFRNKHLV